MVTFNKKSGFYLAVVATIFSMFVVSLGAYTRLVDAGLGCPDWPTCYGHIWAPTTSEAIASANEAFPDMPVDLDKTWPEMVHRYLASTLGLLVIALVYFSFRSRSQFKNIKQSAPIKLSIFLLGFVILQGMFGMWTVTLKLWPQVVTAHLLGGFTTFCLLLILSLRLSGIQFMKVRSSLIHRLPHKLAKIALVVLFVQVLLGGWTTSNYAALACVNLTSCHGALFPEMDFSTGFNFLQTIGPNYLGGQLDTNARIAIHYSHRMGALITTIVLLATAWRLFFAGLPKIGVALAVLTVVQVLLGMSNVYFVLPLFNAVAHNLMGAVLLVFTVFVNYRLYKERDNDFSIA